MSQSVSAKMAGALVGSHRVTSSVTVLYGGVAQATLPPADGAVGGDKTAAVRCTLDAGFSGRTVDLAPLQRIGVELQVTNGVVFPDGTSELLAQGIYRVEDLEARTLGLRTSIRVRGLDRSAGVQDARFTVPTSVAAGTNYATAITAILQPALPAGCTITLPTTTYTTPALSWDEEGDRWAACQDMASAVGWRLVFGPTGNVVGSVELDTASAPVAYNFVDGANGVVVSRTSSVSRGTPKVYNGAIVIGADSTGAPVRGEAYDTDASSATRWGGPFGNVPTFLRTTYVTTTAQAGAAAAALLLRSKRSVVRYVIECAPQPQLEDGDVVTVDGQRCVILSRRLPLGAGTMTLECSQ
jgi:hypothetical protein